MKLHTTLLVSAGLSAAIGSSAMAGIAANDWLISDFESGFYSYEQGSGTASLIGEIPRSLIGIDFAGDGMLYGITTFGNGNDFYRINASTGESTLVGNTGLTGIIEGDLAYDATTNQLFGNYGDSMTNSLYTINLATGVATVVGPSEEDDISGLAFDQAGRLWGVDTNVGGSRVADLVEIDKTTGDVLSRSSLGIQVNGPLIGMDINDLTGELFMAMDNGNFYSIDTVAGSATFVDTHGVMTATGLAYGIPAPSSVLALMGAGLLGARRRR